MEKEEKGDAEPKEKPEGENLKQMQDVRSSQASAVIQLFLKQIQVSEVTNTPKIS